MVLLFLQTLPFCIFISFKVLGSKCLRIEGLLFWYASSLSTYITFFLFFKYHYFLHAFLYFAETAYGFNCVFVTFLGPEWLSVILNVAFSSSSFFFFFFFSFFFSNYNIISCKSETSVWQRFIQRTRIISVSFQPFLFNNRPWFTQRTDSGISFHAKYAKGYRVVKRTVQNSAHFGVDPFFTLHRSNKRSIRQTDDEPNYEN